MTRLILATVAACSLPAQAVIVAGANGGGNTTNNTTAASLATWASANGYTAAPAFDNVIRLNNSGNTDVSSGVYLGYDPTSRDVWVLSARHIESSTNLTSIGGTSYTHQERIIIPDSDLVLHRYLGPVVGSQTAVPTLPAVNLASSSPSASATTVLIGWGRNRVENAATDQNITDAVSTTVGTGYHWEPLSPNPPATPHHVQRWGTNNIDANLLDSIETDPDGAGPTGILALGGYSTTVFQTTFTAPPDPGGPTGPWLTTTEAQASQGDSGGGFFTWNGSEWTLAGAMSTVRSSPGQDLESSAFGNLSLATDVATYYGEILAITGTLIPEPAALASLLLALPLLAGRRR